VVTLQITIKDGTTDQGLYRLNDALKKLAGVSSTHVDEDSTVITASLDAESENDASSIVRRIEDRGSQFGHGTITRTRFVT
jgi:copper chaperone CopZ